MYSKQVLNKHLLSRARYNQWLKMAPEDVCTLCQWNEYQIVLKELKSWVWVANIAPYRKYHTMLIPKRHIESIGQVRIWEWFALVKAYQYALWRLRELRISDRYIIFWRKRDNYLGKNGEKKLEHLHIHFLPDKENSFDPILDKNAVSKKALDNLLKLSDNLEKESWLIYAIRLLLRRIR